MASILETSNQKRLPMEVSGHVVLPRRVKTVDTLVAECPSRKFYQIAHTFFSDSDENGGGNDPESQDME